MGIQDRDWWRENYAEKTGKIYDRASGRYLQKKPLFKRLPKIPTMHPLLTVIATVAIILIVIACLKFTAYLLKIAAAV